MEAESKVKLAREQFPVVDRVAYFDTASVGPVSTIYAETLRRETAEDLRFGRALARRWTRIEQSALEIRAELARLLNTSPDRITLTKSTRDGVGRALRRIDWTAGDEIVTTRLEFPACAAVVEKLAREAGVVLTFVEVPAARADETDWLEARLTPKTRLVVCSAVGYATGQRLPIERIARLANERGISTLIDGAQLVGAGALDLGAVPVDFVAFPLQKWLCGPEGLGALYDAGGASAQHDDALAPATGHPMLAATARHLAWLRETLGWRFVHARTAALADHARRALAGAAAVVTPPEHAGLIAFRASGESSETSFERLAAAGFIVRHRADLDLLRISPTFFNTEQEIDALAHAMDIVI